MLLLSHILAFNGLKTPYYVVNGNFKVKVESIGFKFTILCLSNYKIIFYHFFPSIFMVYCYHPYICKLWVLGGPLQGSMHP